MCHVQEDINTLKHLEWRWSIRDLNVTLRKGSHPHTSSPSDKSASAGDVRGSSHGAACSPKRPSARLGLSLGDGMVFSDRANPLIVWHEFDSVVKTSWWLIKIQKTSLAFTHYIYRWSLFRCLRRHIVRRWEIPACKPTPHKILFVTIVGLSEVSPVRRGWFLKIRKTNP